MKALFLDRDGVLNVLKPNDYVKSPEELILLPHAAKAVAILRPLFDYIIVVTNQQGIGKGLMSEEDLTSIHHKLVAAIQSEGGSIDKIYHCPHLESSHHFCRKPNIGMALQARRDLPALNLRDSIMVGDTMTDMLFGRRARMTTLLVGNDSDTSTQKPWLVDYYYPTLYEFALHYASPTRTRGSIMP